MQEERVFKIFVDFDGTIIQQDVGEEFFLKFGNRAEVDRLTKLWIEGEIGSSFLWIEYFKTLKTFTAEEFEEFLRFIYLDVAFKKFVKFCDDNNFELTVVSDGFDFYIDPILERENLDHLKVYCNKSTRNEDNKLIPDFPYMDSECKECANCKRNHVITHSGDEEYSIYIGDGLSDKCPAQFCDYIFAKKSLLKFCEKNRISYYPFTTFDDVIKRIDDLKNKKRLRKRHQAFLKRREVYLMG